MGIIKKFRITKFKNQQPLISLKNISISFGKRKVLDNISFNVNKGSIMGLLGPNGVGKSTIFSLILGQLQPDYGIIKFGKVDATNYPIYLRTKEFKIGYVPQHTGYFHDLTLIENFQAIAEVLIVDEKKRMLEIDSLISKFELDAVKDVKAKFLSGGQKKKCVIAMALLGSPNIVLLDEPFSALDILTIKMLQEIIVNLQSENPSMCIMLCDHAARDLLTCCDNAIILSNTHIVAQGTPSQLIKDDKAKTAYFGDSFRFN